jgi:hypothetical protein
MSAVPIHVGNIGVQGQGVGQLRNPRALSFYAALHCAWFALYALLGKGFAYAGWQPFFAGEILLTAAIFALFFTGRVRALVLTPLGIIMACFLAWQAACMVPYLETYGLDSLRDSVIWAYSAFAWVVAALILRLRRPIEFLLSRYLVFVRLYLFLGPIAWLATLYLRDQLPVWSGTSVTIPLIKGGDYAVQLAGIFAFTYLGLRGSSIWWAVVVVAEAILGMASRGGLVAFLSACALIVMLRPRARRTFTTLAVALVLIALAATLDVRFTPPGTTREMSFDLLSSSLLSVVSESERADLENTKGWRLRWWSHISDYTFSGAYFWTGKGYGINLADSDGFQVGSREEPLRSPHNSHLTILARSGVPGFVSWIALQVAWIVAMMRSYWKAKEHPDATWCRLFAWLIAFWMAFVIEAGFDVSLEGPMAGIPFWSIFGVGWGSAMVFSSSAALRRLGQSRAMSV